ncbi:MAG: TonB-dependent receptor [Desulfobulbaceae bacterium]|nr:TonB-dependent receptor [Desulfobulbaceae bacterium]
MTYRHHVVPLLFFVALAVLLSWQPAWAESAPEEASNLSPLLAMNMEDLLNLEVSLATGSAKPLHLAPAVASVITRSDIERMGAASLGEALAGVPGLHIGAMFPYMTAHYSFRGIHTRLNPQVLFLIDGKPVTFAYQGPRNHLFSVPMAMVARVEVIRGPGSALYGADAFAGVINIITMKRSEIATLESGVGYGSFNSSDAWLRHGSTLAGWDTTFGLEYRHSNGDDERIISRDQQNVLDSKLNAPRGLPLASLAPRAGQTQYTYYDSSLSLTKGGFSGKVSGQLSKDQGLGVGLASALDSTGTGDGRKFMTDLGYRYQELHDWDVNLDFRYKYEKMDALAQMFPPGALLPLGADGNVAGAGTPVKALVLFKDGLFGEPIVTDNMVHTELSGVYEGFSKQRLRLASGVNWNEAKTDNYKNFGPGVIDVATLAPPPAINVIDGTLTHLDGSSPYIFMNDQHRTVYYLSLQDEWQFDKHWELTAGGRYDNYSDFGETFNPRAALVWQTRYDLTSKLMYGRAFRAPAMNELYLKNNPSNLGNSSLKPETIDTYELAFDYLPWSQLHTSLNLFQYAIKDLIDNLPTPGASTISAQNARNQDGRGFELAAEWQLADDLRLVGNLAYQRSKDHDTDVIVADAPELQYYLNPQWAFLPGWSLDAQYYRVEKRHRAVGDNRPEVGNYDLVHLVLQRRNIANHWDVKLKIRNIFDEDAREPSPAATPDDYPVEGRNFWAELTYRY